MTCSFSLLDFRESDFNPHPLWRGWLSKTVLPPQKVAISIHTLCEEGDSLSMILTRLMIISIHTLCEEGDLLTLSHEIKIRHFNPHPLWRGWHVLNILLKKDEIISIHTLCEEGDNVFLGKPATVTISIHTLCEEGDQDITSHLYADHIFQSTPSVKRVTDQIIQSYATILNFNPHPLWRGWHLN